MSKWKTHFIYDSFFLSLIKLNYVYEKKWYKKIDEKEIIYGYYYHLRLFLYEINSKYYLLTSCAYCGILFITCSSNKNRNDIYCPFGCRFMHKKKKSLERCENYRKSSKGRLQKKILNQKRYTEKKYNSNPDDKEVLEDFDEKDPNDETFSQYLDFIGKIIVKTDSTKSGLISDLLKKYIKNRDSAP